MHRIPSAASRSAATSPTTFAVCLACLICLSLAAPSASAQNDYMPGDLRDRVDQLKLDIQNIPTNPTNQAARAHILWDWLNAYAINDGYVPVNATQAVYAALSPLYRDLPFVAGTLNDAIAEFVFLDDHPGGVGSLEAELGPYTAGSSATLRQTYTFGNVPMQVGGGFVITQHFMTAGVGAWQSDDPAAPNYVTIASSNPKVTFLATTTPWPGMHGGFRSQRPTLTFRVASGTLERGDTVTVTYGDTSGGSPGMRIPTFSSDRMPYPIYASFEESGAMISLPIQGVVVEGGAIDGVAAFLPSVVAPDEPFTLSVRGQDRFYNRAVGEVPNWQVSLNDEPWMTLPADGAIATQEARIAAPGTYFVTVRSADGEIEGVGNPILVTASGRDRIYWGDTHGHSGFAEGIGTPRRFMEWARDDARLDYVVHSEHDIWMDDAEWEVLRDNVRNFTKEGEFIAYLGWEWSVGNLYGGHHNVFYRTPEGRARIGAQFHPTLSKLYQGLRSAADPADVVVIPHAHQAGDYRQNDPELEPLIEIMSQHGNFEWFGRMYLAHGHQVGFTAASDNHLSQPGYTAPLGGSLAQRGGLGAILAQSRTTDGIFDGMKALKSYATTGDKIILEFEVNGAGMGQRTEFAAEREITGRVIGTAPIDTITVVKNDKVAWQQRYLEPARSSGNRYLLTFASDSTPFNPGDNPRGWRGWEGVLEVHGATLVRIEPYDANFPLQGVERSDDEPNRASFSTKTRGDGSSFIIELDNATRAARIDVDLTEVLETGGAPPIYRKPQRSPAESFSLALKDVEDNRVVHSQAIDTYTDTTTLRRIVETGQREVEFRFSDTGQRQGDYYYVRVVQANDAIAWSSPVWVGGYPKQ